ncbi:MAG: hypothetical protein ACREO5_01695 [Candidatus Binatia bacterium]
MNNGFNLDILQPLYDSEINCEIRWLWDGGIDWKLFAPNDEIIPGNARTVQEAVKELAQAAIKHYPDSNFTKSRK